MRERLDDHSRLLEEQLAGLEALVKEQGEIDAVVPAMDQEEHMRSIRSNPSPSQLTSPSPVAASTNAVMQQPPAPTVNVDPTETDAVPSKDPAVVPSPVQTTVPKPEASELTPNAPDILPSAVAPPEVSMQ